MFDVNTVLEQATLEEKVRLLSGKGLWRTMPIERLGVPAIVMTDGTHGVRYSEAQIDRGESWAKRVSKRDRPSRATLNSAPEWLPFGTSRPATCFPNGAAIACAWDVELTKEIGGALAEECLQMGVSVLLGPGINIRRTPLAGRAYEYYSEDPFLTAELAAAMIIGLQEKGVGACLKHFACNNSEFQRTQMDSVVDERALQEIYLFAFRHAVKVAKPWVVMSSYNRLNGVQAAENHDLLTRLLREEWGYEGLVVSDWSGVKDRALSLQAGNDLAMPEYDVHHRELWQAVLTEILPPELVDVSARRVLELVKKAHANLKPGHRADFAAHHRLAQRVARESIVLLKNEDAILPIGLSPKKLLVLGPLAVSPVIQGSGCATTTPWALDKPLEEIRRIAGDNVEVTFAAGCGQDGLRDEVALAEAIELAARSDVAVIFVSSPIGDDGENGDRRDLSILPAHDELIRRIAAIQPDVVVVAAHSDSILVPWLSKVKGLIETFYAGQGMGRAVAEILFGQANPCGRLTTTAPSTLEETPAFLTYPGENHTHLYSESIYVGYRYYDKRKMQPRFPFGFGLSYTRFSYEDLKVSSPVVGEGETLHLDVIVRNVGSYAGKEVVQVYVAAPAGRLARPPLELKAFAKTVLLQPGQSRVLRLDLPISRLSCYDPGLSDWVVEPGSYRILVGASSRDIRLEATVRIDTPVRLPPLKEDSTLAELIAHDEPFLRVCALFASKTGESMEAVRELLEDNAPDIFTSTYRALTSVFGLELSREELSRAIHAE